MVGCGSVSAATKICQAFEQELEVNPTLREVIKALVEQFSTFKGRPL
jgi:hypothetical protein